MAELPERLCEEAIWAYRLPDAFIKSRIPSLEPRYATLFQEALKFVAFAIVTRETAPDFSSAILRVWRRSLGAVPGVDTPGEPERGIAQRGRRVRGDAPTNVFIVAVVVLVLAGLAAIGGAFDGLIPSTRGWSAFRDWASEPGSNAESLERRRGFAQMVRSSDTDRSAMSSILADERQYIG